MTHQVPLRKIAPLTYPESKWNLIPGFECRPSLRAIFRPGEPETASSTRSSQFQHFISFESFMVFLPFEQAVVAKTETLSLTAYNHMIEHIDAEDFPGLTEPLC